MSAVAALPWTRKWMRLPGPGSIGGIVVVAMVAGAMLAGVLAPFEPQRIAGSPAGAPSAQHLLGTNDLGQDLFSLWLHGARASLGVGFIAAALSTALAATAALGSVLWRPGRTAVLGLTDVLLAIPHLPVLVLLVALLGPGFWHLVAVLAMLGWPAYARVVRAQLLNTVQRDYVEAARALGASGGRILRTCLLPEIAPLLWTKFLLTVRWAILMEATLALLGLGDPTGVSWGMMLNSAFTYPLLFVRRAWVWWALPPSLSIAVITLALAMIGQDFEMWLNPAARGGRESTR